MVLEEEERHDHGRIWAKVNELELYIEKRMAQERERVSDQLKEIAKEMRTYILESTGTNKELMLKVDALHERWDGMRAQIEEKEKASREESKVIKREKRGWWWGLVAAFILIAGERLIAFFVWVYEKLHGGGGKG